MCDGGKERARCREDVTPKNRGLAAACGQTTAGQPSEPSVTPQSVLVLNPLPFQQTMSPAQFTAIKPSDAELRAIVAKLLDIQANSTVRHKFIRPITDRGYGIIAWNNAPMPSATPTPSVQIKILSNAGSWRVGRNQQLDKLGIFGNVAVEITYPDGTSKLYTLELFLGDSQTEQPSWRGMCPEMTNDLKIWVQ